MSWHTDQLKYALGFGGVLSLYGIIGLVTYMVPYPTLGYMERTVIVLAFVVITLPFFLLFAFLMSRRRKKREAREATAAGTDAQASESTEVNGQPARMSAPTGNYGDLAGGFEEAVQFLKSSNLGTGGKDAIYGLPWYLVAGAPKAGKSSLVISSNLNFQTLPSQRQSEQSFVRPTSNIDWRVTSEAVFIDSAGRYQTEGLDADEFSGLLETLKKYRSNRPLDGVILVVDAERILKADEREIEQLAKVQRARLDEVMQRLKVKFPVYLVFSHADAIEGFRDSFSASKAEDKSLVWGATIPIEKAENAQALFDNEYAILHDSIMKRRIARLSAPFPPVRQLRIFNFPLHFGTGRRKFGAFINSLFRPNPFSENPFLRGFYFTAAPAAKAAGNGHQTVAGSYFTERFFRDVILRDKDLVKTFIAQRQKAPIFGWMVTILGGLLLLFLLGMTVVSLVSNNRMLSRAEDLGDRVLTIVKADGGRNPLEKNEQEAKREIATTEEIRQLLAQLDDNERNGPPVYMRMGLYSGNQVYKKSLLPMYFSVIEQRYKRPTVTRLEGELKKFADSQPVANPSQLTEKEEQNLSRHYDLLKAYLMLSGEYKARAESSHISTALADFWVAESKVPPDMKLVAQQQLEFWSKQVDRDDADVTFPRIGIKGDLVDATRKKLQAFPAKYRYLSRKVTEISKQVDDSIGKTTTDAILTRSGADATFIEGNYSVPSAYTRPGHDLMKVAIDEANQKLSEDDWVMGELGKTELATSSDATDIRDRYYRDYADHWRNFVKNTHVKAYKNKEEAANALLSFSQANSPIAILMREVTKHTNLSAKPEEEGWIAWALSYVMPAESTQAGDTQPEKEFRPLVTFMGTKDQGDKTPIADYRTQLGNVHKSIAGISEAKFKEAAAEMSKDGDPLKIRQRETQITTLLATFSETPSAGEASLLFQEPLNNLKTLLGQGAKDKIVRTWAQEIMPASKEIEKGYPFDDSGDADLTKLTAFLNPTDGKLSAFYKNDLAVFFEEVDNKLKLKDGAAVQFSDEFITYLNNAFALRKALFGTNATPKFTYEFVLGDTKDTMISIKIDGQEVSTEKKSVQGSFPASGSSETGVSINLSSTATATSTTPANSNTSAPASPSSSSGPGYTGTWGLFKFVHAGNPAKQPGGEYKLTHTAGGKSFSSTIKPSGGDPFNRKLFQDVKAPQTIAK